MLVETYVEALSSSNDDSATESTGSDSKSESTEDEEDEEDDALVQPTRKVKLSQKMALEVSLSSFRTGFITQDHLEALLAI